MQTYQQTVDAQSDINFKAQEQLDKYAFPSEFIKRYVNKLGLSKNYLKVIDNLDMNILNVNILEKVFSTLYLVPVRDIKNDDWTIENYLKRNIKEIRQAFEDFDVPAQLDVIRYLELVLRELIEVLLNEESQKEVFGTFEGGLFE